MHAVGVSVLAVPGEIAEIAQSTVLDAKRRPNYRQECAQETTRNNMSVCSPRRSMPAIDSDSQRSSRTLLHCGLDYVDDIVPDGVHHQIAHRVQLQLAHDIRAMGFSCLHAQSQRHRDLFRALAFGQQLHDFALARSEPVSSHGYRQPNGCRPSNILPAPWLQLWK